MLKDPSPLQSSNTLIVFHKSRTSAVLARMAKGMWGLQNLAPQAFARTDHCQTKPELINSEVNV